MLLYKVPRSDIYIFFIFCWFLSIHVKVLVVTNGPSCFFLYIWNVPDITSGPSCFFYTREMYLNNKRLILYLSVDMKCT